MKSRKTKSKSVKAGLSKGKKLIRKPSRESKKDLNEIEEGFDEEEHLYIDSEDEEEIKQEISEEIEDFLSYRPDFVVIEFTKNWTILARFKKLKINTVSNPNGFQPVENNKESKECLITLVQFGEEPLRGHLAYHLKRGGCPTVKIRSKHEVNPKLENL